MRLRTNKIEREACITCVLDEAGEWSIGKIKTPNVLNVTKG